MAIIAAVVVGALVSAYSAYAQAESAQQAANAQMRLLRRQAALNQQAAESEAAAQTAAGEARRRQVEYDAATKMRTFHSREAAAGVQIGQGSLLEEEMQFASDSEYAAQIAQYPYKIGATQASYRGEVEANSLISQGQVYGAQAKRINPWLNAGIATVGSLATSYGSYAGRLKPAATTTEPKQGPAY